MQNLANMIGDSWKNIDESWQAFAQNTKSSRSTEKISIQLDDKEPQEGLTFEELSERFNQCRDYVDAILKSPSINSIPARSIKRIAAMLDEAKAQILDANKKFDEMKTAGGLAKIDKEQLTLSSADDVIKIDLGAVYRAVFERLERRANNLNRGALR